MILFLPQGFHYALVRPTNATHESIIVQVGPTDLRGKDAVTVEVKVLNGIWLLRVSKLAAEGEKEAL